MPLTAPLPVSDLTPELERLRQRLLAKGLTVFHLREVRDIYRRDLGHVPAALEKTLFSTTPDLVVQPGSAAQVLEVLDACGEGGVPIVPRGVASWGFGGCVPTRGGVVLDFSSWLQVSEVSTDGTLSVAPGARWGEIEAVLEPAGFTLGVYPSNRFATVGGWVATGGYGLMSGGHGHLREWITELQVASPEGGLRTLAAGEAEFDLFFGSEGQLGVLVGATVRGRPTPESCGARLVLAETSGRLTDLLGAIAEAGVEIGHAKFLDAAHVTALNTLWEQETGERGAQLFPPQEALLLVFESAEAEEAYLRIRTESGLQEAPPWVGSYLWEDRFNPLRVQLLGPSLLASESVVPLEALSDFQEGTRRLAGAYGATVYMEAHLVKEEGTLKWLLLPMIPCDQRDQARYARLLTLVSLLTRLGIRVGGRPYGVGIWNTPFVRQRYSSEELSRLRRAKDAADPRGILNPGKFFGIRSRQGGLPGLVLHRAVVGPGLALLSAVAPLVSPFLKGGGDTAPPEPGHYPPDMNEETFLSKTLSGCTQCGNCVVVCPAYRVSEHEGTTARVKLRLVDKLLAGEAVTSHESDTAFLCTHCGECERVCQTHLPLVRAWDVLEAKLSKIHGRPEEQIRRFVDDLGQNPVYLKMLGTTPFQSGAAMAAPAPAGPTWVPRTVASGKLPGPGASPNAARTDPWARVSVPSARRRDP